MTSRPADGAVPAAEREGWRRLWALDALAGAVELGSVVGLSAWVFGTGRALLPWAGGMFVVLVFVWAWVAERLTAPLRSEQRARDLALSYGAAVRLSTYSLWLRVALVTAASALLGLVGVVRYGVPPYGVPLLVWCAALLTVHLDGGRALLYERQARAHLRRRHPQLELRYLADTLQGRIMLTSFAYGGLGFLLISLAAMATTPDLRGDPRGLRVEDGGALWLPPAIMILLFLRGLWLRRRVRPLDRCIADLIVAATRPHAPREPGADERLYLAACRTVAWLPYWLGAAKLLLGLCSILLASAVFGTGGSVGAPRLVLLGGQAVFLWVGVALLEIPAHQATLAPLWPHLAQRAAALGAEPGFRRGPLRSGVPSLPGMGRLLVGTVASLVGALLLVLWLWLAARSGLGGLFRGGLRPGWLLAGGAAVGAAAAVSFLLARALRATAQRVTGLLVERGGGAGERRLPWLPAALGGRRTRRLDRALDAVGQSIRERVFGSVKAQAVLEAEVAARTAELAARNDELRAALSELERAQRELVRAEQVASIGRLVAGIAHEINNPINAVINTASPLLGVVEELTGVVGAARSGGPGAGGHLPPAGQALRADLDDMLPVLLRGARRIQEIVQALHSYSHGAAEAAPAPADLNRFLDEALELVQHPFKAQVTFERDYGPLPGVLSVGGQLQQVFVNLLSNAVQALAAQHERSVAAPAGGAGGGADDRGSLPRPVVRMSTRHAAQQVVVVIADSGPGIAADVLPRIFDPFFTTKAPTEGTGLGLSIAHSIAQRHGGVIRVRTEVGSGTVFTVTLPVAP